MLCALNASRRLMMEMPGGYSIGLTGDVQIDTGLYDFHADNRAVGPQALSDGVNARRARLGVFGTGPGYSWSTNQSATILTPALRSSAASAESTAENAQSPRSP